MALKKHKQIDTKDAYSKVTDYIVRFQKTTSLYEVFDLHKQMWNDGIQHPNFGPNPLGMFRCMDISAMTPEQVILANIKGVWSNSLRFFEDKYMQENLIDADTYLTVLNQYRNHMVSNLNFIRSTVYDCGISSQNLQRYLEEHINDKVSANVAHHVSVTVPDGFVAGELKDIVLRCGGKDYKSSLLIILDKEDSKARIFMPSAGQWGKSSNYLPPHLENGSEISNYEWTNISTGQTFKIERSFFKDRFILSNNYSSTIEKTESSKKQREHQKNLHKKYIKTL